MTVNATCSIDGVPIAFGDILISGSERTDAIPSLPAVGPTTNVFPLGSGYAIVGLKQKVHILSPNCVIAWSGSAIHAKLAIKELRHLAQFGPLTLKVIEKYLAENKIDIDGHVDFLGWALDAGRLINFSFPAVGCSSSLPFRDLCVSGSGASRFRSIIHGLPTAPPQTLGALTPIQKAIATSLLAVGSMLQGEFITQENLVQYFGGGWEIAAFNGNRFYKFGNVTYLFWIAESTPAGLELTRPQLILKQDYLYDLLRIRVARIAENQLFENECYLVSPVDFTISESEKLQLSKMPLPNLNSTLLCHCVLVKSMTPSRVFVRIEVPKIGRIPDTVIRENVKGFDVTVTREFRQEILSAISQADSH